MRCDTEDVAALEPLFFEAGKPLPAEAGFGCAEASGCRAFPAHDMSKEFERKPTDCDVPSKLPAAVAGQIRNRQLLLDSLRLQIGTAVESHNGYEPCFCTAAKESVDPIGPVGSD
jgi:hypothetical protein